MKAKEALGLVPGDLIEWHDSYYDWYPATVLGLRTSYDRHEGDLVWVLIDGGLAEIWCGRVRHAWKWPAEQWRP